uniref:BHLH domain-containing protein n=1 Tax=Timema genevievae TaxID=629358 RepID=A0A7R9JPQ7_TIMGE|nr:unnamed protein product [Timema genevievae]
MDMLDHSLESSQDPDGEGSNSSVLGDSKELISTQSLTIVEEDGSMGSGEEQSVVELAHQQALLDGDDDVQYQFRSGDGGTVTYRIVQVGPPAEPVDPIPQIVSAPPGFTPGASVQQVLASPINGGQFYVINPQEVFTSQSSRSLAPRSNIQIESTRGSATRDDRRRATHNEVERRRRDKINNWILKLSKIIPDCTAESAKTAQVSFEGQSKGGILAKACEYIMELRSSNQRLSECLKDNERLIMDLDLLRQQNEELKRNNSLLRTQLSQHGIIPSTDLSSVS